MRLHHVYLHTHMHAHSHKRCVCVWYIIKMVKKNKAGRKTYMVEHRCWRRHNNNNKIATYLMLTSNQIYVMTSFHMRHTHTIWSKMKINYCVKRCNTVRFYVGMGLVSLCALCEHLVRWNLLFVWTGLRCVARAIIFFVFVFTSTHHDCLFAVFQFVHQ